MSYTAATSQSSFPCMAATNSRPIRPYPRIPALSFFGISVVAWPARSSAVSLPAKAPNPRLGTQSLYRTYDYNVRRKQPQTVIAITEHCAPESRPTGKYGDFARSPREEIVTAKTAKPMMILIAGPYRSGTNDDPALIKKNVRKWSPTPCPSFAPDTSPLGEWLALPLVELAGSRTIGDEAFNEIFHPIAVRLLEKCDAVLRVGGPSAGADEMIRVGRDLGLKIYTAASEIPQAD